MRLNSSSRDLSAETCIRRVVHAARLSQLNFYTDGSLSHPACPHTSHGGWSVVLDLAPDTPATVSKPYWSQHLEPMPELVVAACGPTCDVKPFLCKIKAHQHPGRTPDIALRQVLGNCQADRAAGKARDAEMSRVREDGGQLAQAHHLVQYYTYLVDLAKLVAPQKRAIMRG